MIFRAVDCPHCGNTTTVSSEHETSKCKWCRRLMSVKFKGAGKKAKVEVEAIDFPEDEIQNEFEEQKTKKQRKSYSSWKDEDIYGDKQNIDNSLQSN